MASVKFYLDKRPRKRGNKQSIILSFWNNNQSFLYYPRISVDPNNWDQRKGRIKKGCKEAPTINGILDVFEAKLYEIERELRLAALLNNQAKVPIKDIQEAFYKIVCPEKLKPKASEEVANTPKSEKEEKAPILLSDLFTRFIQEKRHTYTDNTLKVFRRVHKHLLHFAKKTGESLEASKIDLRFQREYLNYLIEEHKYANSTIGTEIKKVHAVLGHYLEEHNNFIYKKFKIPSYESKRFICSYKEIVALYKYQPKEDMHLRVRDCAVFSFFTGLSFADMCNLKLSNLLDDTLNGEPIKIIDFKRKKTKRYNQIPLNKICIEIIAKWRGKLGSDKLLPVYLNDQTMNKYLHELLRESGLFDREVQSVKESGKKRIETYLPRWKAITFHSFRHGFASYLASQDVNPITIQKLMGHSDMKTTMIYIQQNRKKAFAEALDKLEK